MTAGTGLSRVLIRALPLVFLNSVMIAGDPRIAYAGKRLRNLGPNGLPQFIKVFYGDIPLRILKMRQVFSEKKLGVFALPANEVRTNSTAFSQVSSLKIVGLRALRCVPSHSTVTFDTSSQFLAKRVSSFEIQAKAVA